MKEELTEILPLINYFGQLVIFVSSATISKHDTIEKNTTPISNRFQNFSLFNSLDIPVVLYMKPVLKGITINDLELYKKYIEKYNIKAIAHITGGGVIENITRVIPDGLGLDIKTDSWEKPPIFKMIEGFNIVEKRELHKSFNMGIGIVFIVNKEDAPQLVDYINNREQEKIEIDKKYVELMQDKAYIVGEVVDSHKGVELC